MNFFIWLITPPTTIAHSTKRQLYLLTPSLSCSVTREGNFCAKVNGEVLCTPWASMGRHVCEKNGNINVDILTDEDYQGGNLKDLTLQTFIPMTILSTCCFVAVVGCIRIILLTLSKWKVSDQFRKSSLQAKIGHIMYYNLGATPVTFTQWDKTDTPATMWQSYCQQCNEMATSLLLNMMENLVLLVPLCVTFLNSSKIHTILENSIKATAKESDSLKTLTNLTLVSCVAVVVAFLIECVLYWIYLNKFHIWKMILADVRNTTQVPIKCLK